MSKVPSSPKEKAMKFFFKVSAFSAGPKLGLLCGVRGRGMCFRNSKKSQEMVPVNLPEMTENG